MLQRIVDSVFGKLTFDGLIRTAGAVSLRVTALDHESLDDPVKSQAIVETLPGQIHKIFHGHRRRRAVQLHRDGAVILYMDFHMMQVFR